MFVVVSVPVTRRTRPANTEFIEDEEVIERILFSLSISIDCFSNFKNLRSEKHIRAKPFRERVLVLARNPTIGGRELFIPIAFVTS